MKSHAVSSSSLLKSILFQRFRWRLLILGLSLLCAICGIAAPYAQKHFVDELLAGGASQRWIWAAFILTVTTHAFWQMSLWVASRESFITQKSLGDASYSRILEGPGGFIGHKPAGEGISLFAVDVQGAAAILDQAFIMAGSMVFPLLLAPIALHVLFEIPWLSSLSAILTLSFINFILARRQSRYFYSFKQLAAERTGLVAEWVQNIRTLRILGWIKSIEAKIFKVRIRETTNRLGMLTNGQVMNSIATSGTYFLNILVVLLLVNMRKSVGREPTPGELLSLLWIMGVFLARPLRQFPWAIVISMDSFSSMVRLQRALQLPITQPQVMTTQASSENFAIEVSGLNLEIDGRNLLKNINLSIKKNEFVGIVGEVGCGKTLLLQSLMGATGAKFHSFSINGVATAGPADPAVRSQMAFIPQEGFTMSASLRENVMFTYLEEPSSFSQYKNLDERVLNSLKLAQFLPENERVRDGLETEIGERGVNLSGGQRQRVSIARAHYANRPIILMDDSLSAVDVDTEAQLIEKLICGDWKTKTRLLVTQRMAVLPWCDRVIFIENGQITHQGTYAELHKHVPQFREFVRREDVRTESKTSENMSEDLTEDLVHE